MPADGNCALLWAIVGQNPSTGHFSKRVQGEKKLVLYFTYLPRRTLMIDWHKFWVTCSSRGHNYAKFYRNQLGVLIIAEKFFIHSFNTLLIIYLSCETNCDAFGVGYFALHNFPTLVCGAARGH